MTKCIIFVVENDEDTASSLLLLLRLRGHDAHWAASGHAALEMVVHPEVILLDLAMPGMNGYDVAKRFRERGRPAFIVAVTGYAHNAGLLAEAGIDMYLQKPVDPRMLLQLIDHRCLAAHT